MGIFGRQPQFIGYIGVGNQSAVGIDGYPQSDFVIKTQRVIFKGAGGLGLNVAGQAYFHGNAVIVDIIEQIAVFL